MAASLDRDVVAFDVLLFANLSEDHRSILARLPVKQKS